MEDTNMTNLERIKMIYERDSYRAMLIEIRIMATNAKPMQREIIEYIDDNFGGE